MSTSIRLPAVRAVAFRARCATCGSETCAGPRRVALLHDRHLANPHFIRALREFLARKRISRLRMLDWLMGILRDNPCAEFVDASGRIVDLDFDVLEIDQIEWWFKDFCQAPKPGVRPRVKRVARPRIRVVASILRVGYPATMRTMEAFSTTRET